jgi:WD40 repeat protein/Flp pilus assembly protein TadD
VLVYDARTGQEVFALKKPVSEGSKPVYSPDGARIAVAGIHGVVRMYDARSDQETSTTAKMPRLSWTRCVYSPDGARIAAVDSRGVLGVYDARSGQEVWSHQRPAGLGFMMYSPDGSRIAVRDNRNGAVRVYDARTAREVSVCQFPVGHGWPAFSPDGTRIAAHSNDAVARVCDVQTGREILALQGVTHLPLPAFSPDGTRIAAVGNDKVVRVYDTRTREEVFPLKGQSWSGSGGVVFSPDGKRIIAAESGGRLRSYDAGTGQEVPGFKQPSEAVGWLAYSPDGARFVGFVSSPREGLRVYDAGTGQEVLALRWEWLRGGRPSYSRDGTRIMAWSKIEEMLHMWVAPNDAADWQAERRKALVEGIRAWHRSRAAESERNREWFAAAFHWGWLAKAEPDSGRPHLGLGLALAHLGRAAEAKVEFEKALALKKGLGDLEQVAAHAELGQWGAVRKLYAKVVEAPDATPRDLAPLGPQHLGRGDRTGYSLVCSTLLDRFGKTNNPAFADEVAWICAIGPQAVPDLEPAVELARLAVRANPKNHYPRNTLGAILIRAGQYQEAVRELNEAIKLHGRGGTSWNFLFLAMAHHQLGKQSEARSWLARGLGPNASTEIELNEIQRLTLQLLRREAEALLKGSAPAEKK